MSRQLSATNRFIGDYRELSDTYTKFITDANIQEIKNDVSQRIYEMYNTRVSFTDEEVVSLMKSVFDWYYSLDMTLMINRCKYQLYEWARVPLDRQTLQLHDELNRRRQMHGTTDQLYATIGTPTNTAQLRKSIRGTPSRAFTVML